jgi:hypothetical protein
MTLDLAAARDWLRDHLPKGEAVELSDELVLDRAALVVRMLPEQRQAS